MGVPVTVPVTVPVAERIRELYAEAQRQLLLGNANFATLLRDEAYQLERMAAEATNKGR